ncbi:hypothetical protein BDD43_5138 [Mucilaginibacter gracilis]|uniref:Uncharacterized protein n=1 Tax=Mucilaginibacter gracilis TaxID=423350 RepID=A0A495J7B3_9SPHI|nr:hypothetical protein [Mucilaginibacter gracilis]RKR84885.1 hypothetical protein BDD43_5138 [Mucilaginibacter gracilis]
MKTPLSNFIPINRKLFKHEFWAEKRQYSKFEAWLDLITSARFDNTEGRVLIGSNIVRWNRGELPASIRFLMERWGWTKNKVESFLKLLKSEQMITTRTAPNTTQTIITICNYESYNTINKTASQQTGHQPDTDPTTAGQQPDETNKANKQKIDKQRTIYRAFAHLVLFTDEYDKLIDAGYTVNHINKILDEVENYKNNKKYTSLYLTAKKWLERENLNQTNAAAGAGKIVQITNAFQQALQYR